MALFENDALLRHPYLIRMPRNDVEWTKFIQALNGQTIDFSAGGAGFDEAAQDAVGSILTDTTSINFTYDDTADLITAVVVPSGVDHNQLANLPIGDFHPQYTRWVDNETITGAWVFQNTLEIESTSPRLLFDQTDGGANQRLTDIFINGPTGNFRTRTDADAVGQTIFEWIRSGTTLTDIRFGGATQNFLFQLSSSFMTASWNQPSLIPFAIQNLSVVDGSSAAVVAGSDGFTVTVGLVSLPAATTVSPAAGGPAGAHNILDSSGGPLVVSLDFTEKLRLTSTLLNASVDVQVSGAGNSFLGAGSVPAGGLAGQQLTKNTGTDYDVSWADAGATVGPQGPQGEPGEDGSPGPPGPTGAAGATGAAGPAGPAGADGVDGVDGDPGPPGLQGPEGAQGIQGLMGPALMVFSEDGLEGDRGPPGPTGPAGAGGGGGASATTVEINLGATALTTGSFTITDAGISSTSKVMVWVAPGPYTGKGTRADESEFYPIHVTSVVPASGTARVNWQSALGFTWNKRPMAGGGPSPALVQSQKDPQANVYGELKRLGRIRGNVKFSYVVFA